MPKCRNDNSKYYKGSEPSPKGKGWCAHAEKVGTKKRGNDKNVWIVKKIGKTKRWVKVHPKKPVKTTKKPTIVKKSNRTIDFRMIIGYYTDNWDEDAKTLSKPEIVKMMQTKQVWDTFDISMETGVHTYERGTYNVLPKITPSNVKSIKVQNPPKHNPTLGEKIMKKHQGWVHNPNMVIIVDLQNVELRPFDVPKNEKSIPTDIEFPKWIMYNANYSFSASGGWIGEIRRFGGGNLYMLQISKKKIKVDYRKFGGTSPL